MRVATLLVTLVTLSTSALGHIALWDEGMFGSVLGDLENGMRGHC